MDTAHILDQYREYFSPEVSRDELIQVVDSLPSMPSVAAKALKLTDDPNSTTTEIAEVLGKDAILAVRLLKQANSAYYSQSQTIENLEHAAGLIGLSNVRSLILSSVMRGIKKHFGKLETIIWRNSVATGIASELLGKSLFKSQINEVYLSGLLHNLGQLVFLAHEGSATRYPEILRRVVNEGCDFASAEMDVIGFTFPMIGALVTNKWGLPKPISHAVLHHNDPFEGIGDTLDRSALLINLSRWLVNQAGIAYAHGIGTLETDAPRIATALGLVSQLEEERWSDLIDKLRKRFNDEMMAFNS